jgi:hypothetical protein
MKNGQHLHDPLCANTPALLFHCIISRMFRSSQLLFLPTIFLGFIPPDEAYELSNLSLSARHTTYLNYLADVRFDMRTRINKRCSRYKLFKS